MSTHLQLIRNLHSRRNVRATSSRALASGRLPISFAALLDQNIVESDRIEFKEGWNPDAIVRSICAGRIVARRYRNRRIGEFLKELKLTEGRGTGIPTIRQEMNRNGSPKPVFKTNPTRLYFLIELPIRADFSEQNANGKAQVKAQVKALSATEYRLLDALYTGPKSASDLYIALGYRTLVGGIKEALQQLDARGAIVLTIPEKPRSRNQKRAITPTGRRLYKKSRP